MLKAISHGIFVPRCVLIALFSCFSALISAQNGPIRLFTPAFNGEADLSRTNGFVVDIRDRAAVRNFFNAIYYSGAGARSGWHGSVMNCDADRTSAEWQAAVLDRINFFRAMAGVPADIQFDPELSAKAQRAALMVSANSSISHSPLPTFSCFTPEGAEAAGRSNLALGTSGIDSIEAYIMDAGANYRVGHRRWLLFPQTQFMGNGDIDPPDGSTERRANANWIVDDNFGAARPLTRDGFVAWPPAGYVPYPLVFPRWSFSFPGADFSQAVVNVTSNGVALPVHIEQEERGSGENTLVFVPGEILPESRITASRPAEDVAWGVAISNVIVGAESTNFTYTVTVFDPGAPLSPDELPEVIGSALPEVGRTNRLRIAPVPDATGYDFRVGTLEAFRAIESGDSTDNVAIASSGLYPVIQTNITASSGGAFHLAHNSPPRAEQLTLKATVVPSWRSKLYFQSRLGAASTGQVARVQVSVDDGSSWREIFSQLGDDSLGETNFRAVELPLMEFAGRAIRIRFEYGFPFGAFSYIPGAGEQIGWYLDDIGVTAAQELVVEQVNPVVKPEFQFVPAAERTYYVDARPRFYEEFAGEWTPGKLLTAVPPLTTPVEVQITAFRLQGTMVEIEFVTTTAKIGVVFQLEETSDLKGEWQVVSSIAPGSSDVAPANKFQQRTAGGSRFYRVTVD